MIELFNQDGGRKFERANDKPVALLVPAIKPVCAPPVPAFLVSTKVTFDNDNWRNFRAKFANKIQSAATRIGDKADVCSGANFRG